MAGSPTRAPGAWSRSPSPACCDHRSRGQPMTRLDLLRKNYQRICGLPWDRNVAGPQPVWLAIYDKEDERKLRLRLGLFREATEQVDHYWHAFDCTDTFANWLATPPYSDYSESYFESPSRLGSAPLAAFKKSVAGDLSKTLHSEA